MNLRDTIAKLQSTYNDLAKELGEEKAGEVEVHIDDASDNCHPVQSIFHSTLSEGGAVVYIS